MRVEDIILEHAAKHGMVTLLQEFVRRKGMGCFKVVTLAPLRLFLAVVLVIVCNDDVSHFRRAIHILGIVDKQLRKMQGRSVQSLRCTKILVELRRRIVLDKIKNIGTTEEMYAVINKYFPAVELGGEESGTSPSSCTSPWKLLSIPVRRTLLRAATTAPSGALSLPQAGAEQAELLHRVKQYVRDINSILPPTKIEELSYVDNSMQSEAPDSQWPIDGVHGKLLLFCVTGLPSETDLMKLLSEVWSQEDALPREPSFKDGDPTFGETESSSDMDGTSSDIIGRSDVLDSGKRSAEHLCDEVWRKDLSSDADDCSAAALMQAGEVGGHMQEQNQPSHRQNQPTHGQKQPNHEQNRLCGNERNGVDGGGNGEALCCCSTVGDSQHGLCCEHQEAALDSKTEPGTGRESVWNPVSHNGDGEKRVKIKEEMERGALVESWVNLSCRGKAGGAGNDEEVAMDTDSDEAESFMKGSPEQRSVGLVPHLPEDDLDLPETALLPKCHVVLRKFNVSTLLPEHRDLRLAKDLPSRGLYR